MKGVTDGIAVLDDVLAFVDILDEYFVTSGGVLIERYLPTLHFEDFTLLLLCQAHYD